MRSLFYPLVTSPHARQHALGWLLALMWLGYLASLFTSLSLWPSIILAWLALCLSWPWLAKNNQRQSLILALIGLGCTLWAYQRGAVLEPAKLLGNYVPLLSMLVAVSFLRLLGSQRPHHSPEGARALLSTYTAVHLLGAILNLSILVIMGDRMQKQGRLTPLQGVVLSRGFALAAFWSPFFVAMGVALVAAPGMNLWQVLPVGVLMALVATLLSYLQLKDHAQTFSGYPLSPRHLLLPFSLATLVLILHHFFPEWSVILIITCLAPALALCYVGLRYRSLQPMQEHLHSNLGKMGSELGLFLAAGLLTTGMNMLSQSGLLRLPLTTFGAWEAGLIFPLCLVLAWLGVHAMITIAILSPLLLPLQPDPNLLGMLFLGIWALGSSSSPLSGMNMMLASRYALSGRALWRANAPFALLLWPLFWLLLWLYEQL
ncbi:hypothetical protein [Balneatrix alpica]|uniref:Uncharacterized protein n=1 Tax=Balneatrix alpica TaxID=75684 RepID=A0ABV5ZFS5_9GAMM|nr:hypothetical protein [Balneatrix alpica]